METIDVMDSSPNVTSAAAQTSPGTPGTKLSRGGGEPAQSGRIAVLLAGDRRVEDVEELRERHAVEPGGPFDGQRRRRQPAHGVAAHALDAEQLHHPGNIANLIENVSHARVFGILCICPSGLVCFPEG